VYQSVKRGDNICQWASIKGTTGYTLHSTYPDVLFRIEYRSSDSIILKRTDNVIVKLASTIISVMLLL